METYIHYKNQYNKKTSNQHCAETKVTKICFPSYTAKTKFCKTYLVFLPLILFLLLEMRKIKKVNYIYTDSFSDDFSDFSKVSSDVFSASAASASRNGSTQLFGINVPK